MNRMGWRFLLLAMALLLMSCSGGGLGCSGCASSCGGDPNYKFNGTIAKDSVQLRLTQSGVDFITARIKPIIENLLKSAGQNFDCASGGVTFPTQSIGNGPKDSNGNPQAPSGNNCGIKVGGFPLKASCSGNSPNSTWFYGQLKQSSLCGVLSTNTVKVNLIAPDTVDVKFTIPEVRVRSNAPDLGFCYKGSVSGIIPGQICQGAKASLKKVELILKQLGVDMKLKFVTDPATGKVGMKVDKIDISSSTKFTVNLDGCSNITIPIRIPVINRNVDIKLGGGLCSLATSAIEGIINGTTFLQPIIFRLLGGLIADQFKNIDLLADAKVEMDLPLDKLLGGLGLPGLGQTTPLGMLIQPGKALGVVNKGLSMGMDSGFEASTKNTCVPPRPEPQTQPGPKPPLSGAFHIGAALSKAATDRALWAAYHTGILCLKIRSSDLSGLGGVQLNAGVLSLLAPDLSKIAPTDAPIMIAIQPTQPPEATFGSGQQVNGKLDPTIKLRIPDFGISFYVYMHDRYVRLFKLLLDVNLGVGLVVSPQNALEIAIDPSTIELKNARTLNAYMVKINDPSSLLNLIVNLLTQTLGSNGLSFPLDLSAQISQALGVPITIKINSVARAGAANDWLALKMTMSGNAKPLLPTPHTVAQLHEPAGLYHTKDSRIIPTGQVKVDVPAAIGPHEIEYQYKVDFGLWSTFRSAPQGTLTVAHPMLKVLGKHKIWIRGRLKTDYRTREEVPALVEVVFDPVAPKAEIKANQGHIQISAMDQVTPQASLRYAYKQDGRWIPMDGPRLPLTKSLQSAERLTVRVVDKAGNARILEWSPATGQLLNSSTTQDNNLPQGAWGCTTSPSLPDMSLFGLMLLLLGIIRIRNRA